MNKNIEKIIETHDIVLFDEICVLCNRWAKFLIKYDHTAQFKLASVQSALGQAILQHYDMPLDNFDTMLVIQNGQAYTEFTAFLKVMDSLGRPFSSVKIGYLFPKRMRDFVYRHIAQNRYGLFGTTDYCLFASAENKQHFLENVVYATV